jgi:hypothetical protein
MAVKAQGEYINYFSFNLTMKNQPFYKSIWILLKTDILGHNCTSIRGQQGAPTNLPYKIFWLDGKNFFFGLIWLIEAQFGKKFLGLVNQKYSF